MDGESFKRLVDEYRGRTIANKYRVLAGLGYGNFAVVFLGYEPYRKRLVAIKRFLIPRADVDTVIGEINGMEVLAGKPGIVQFFGYEVEELDPEEKTAIDGEGEDNLRFYIIMEYGGETLERYLRRFGIKPADDDSGEDGARNQARAFRFIRDVLRGLDASHREHVIHRDIKPLNIFISAEGETRIGDFGVAKQVMQEGLHSGTIVGTAQYMAPEQVSEGKYAANVDLFAVGVTLYRILAGRLPFRTTGELLAMQPDLDLPGCAAVVTHVLARSLEKDPGSRYQKAAEMLDDVEAWGRDLEEAHPGILEDEKRSLGEQVRELIGADVLETIRKAEAGEEIVAEVADRQPTAPDRSGIPSTSASRPTGAPAPGTTDRILARPVEAVLPRLYGYTSDRKIRKALKASDRCLDSGDLAGALENLERLPNLEGEGESVLAGHMKVLRALAGREKEIGEEVGLLLTERKYREAESRILPYLKQYRRSALQGKLESIRRYRKVTTRLLGAARRSRAHTKYGRAVRLYRKVLRREPYLLEAARGLEESQRLRSRARVRLLRRFAVLAILLIVAAAGIYLYRTDLAPRVVDGGRLLQDRALYTRPAAANARDLYRLASWLDPDCAALDAAWKGLKEDVVASAEKALERGDLESAADLYGQALLLDPDDPDLREKVQRWSEER